MSKLTYSQGNLQDIAQEMVRKTLAAGAESCEVQVSENWGMTIGVRLDKVDNVTHHQSGMISVTAYVGLRRGRASSNDLSSQSMQDTASHAISIAGLTAEDPCSGLPEPQLLCESELDLDLFHPWNVNVDEAIEIARRCEGASFSTSPQITKSEGATISTRQSGMAFANSLGFCRGQLSTAHSLSATVIATGLHDEMQKGSWYSRQRCVDDLASPESIGDYAAQRALARLGSQTTRTCRAPVIFEAPVATTLIESFVHAATGSNVYRKASFLTNRLGTALFPNWFNLQENPHLLRGLGSANFDHDGVGTKARDVVRAGVLQNYFLSVYSGRKLSRPTTGNSGGAHNLIVQQQAVELDSLIHHMNRGLLVTDLLGHGINYVTGDYSQGAAGFWVENGEIAYPVHEITLAGNLKDMYRGIVSVANDTVRHRAIETGSILIEEMTIGGSL